jgi:type I restriction-modification system DNA methylase subunit
LDHQWLPEFIRYFADLLRCDRRQSEYSQVILFSTALRRLDCVLTAIRAAPLMTRRNIIA